MSTSALGTKPLAYKPLRSIHDQIIALTSHWCTGTGTHRSFLNHFKLRNGKTLWNYLFVIYTSCIFMRQSFHFQNGNFGVKMIVSFKLFPFMRENTWKWGDREGII